MAKKSIKYFAIILLILFLGKEANSQFDKIGFPFHKNFERSEYQAGLQSWMISQAPNGIMYFANNDGLMEFDGLNWEVYPVPNRTIVRSVYAAKDGKIFIGSSNNFGFFESDECGGLEFTSLLKLLPESKRDFGEIWKIHDTDEGIIFQSYEQLIIYKNNKAEVYPAPNFFHFSFYINRNLYITDSKEGVLVFKNKSFIPLTNSEILDDKEICSILPLEDKLLIATTDHGVYFYDGKKTEEWKTTTSNFLKKNQIYCALRIDDGHIAFGTIQNGLIVSTNTGDPVITLNESTGLQNNTVLCMEKDADNNLWLGTDNGIDLLHIDLSLSQLNRWQNLSAGYTAAIHKGILYLGTNRGLFYKKWDECTKYPSRLSDFKMIESVKGQVWKLQVIDGVLFCGHNNGTYIITGTNAEKISTIQGSWIFLHSKKAPDKIIGGTYTGLILFEKKNDNWSFVKKISGFTESARIMEFDEDENIWMSHVYKGVFHIKLNEKYDSVASVNFYNTEKGFKTNYGVNVTKLKGQIVFLSPDGIYQYNDSYDIMEYSELFNELFSNKRINYALENQNGDIWYFSENRIAVKRIQEDGTYTEIIHPFKPLEGNFIGDFQFVYPIDQKHVLFGYENGFIHYDQNQITDYQKPFNVFLNKVKLSRTDSTLFSGHLLANPENKLALKYKENSLHFFFSAVSFNKPEKNQFSTYLNGYDNKWSEWENRLDREFTNLKEGDYAFYVKARNVYEAETESLIYRFTIEPPWSRTSFAYVIYVILLIIIIIISVYFIRKRIIYLKIREENFQRKKFLEREKELQREALISEKEVIRLRNDKLRQEMRMKNKELADSTMQKIHKNKFLINLKSELNRIFIETSDVRLKTRVKKVVKKIDNDINNENNWKIFETHFSNVHEEFLTSLKQEYPKISPAELRLCACLRMNISTKEIASLLNISVRGVEASRYRLRKTINLDRKTNLTDFILSL